ncbi:UDP-N-acetylmuramoyl-L-alanyl-D-glutamate--2,6-diaminopimelate ligase [Bifidobacterium commune]|uniref:UDP-N-acetylmuramoylalanyl-D-glutamate--2,6-diaminopimelate ligase n=1 Tax=Bifidobacterium commune TaxID=1505727 RepID=A0A1C4H077_9BIFI|nr:UDP-N-acetylmuramoyl-L-alanyl-D-glutamate--2,6-diaminopimelate ligase [Bifidobacterium commune]MBB2955159.1 UDP-N-acetylmuramoyl-L-alanyl-D-glutamate--2,6-diaminopimelate ligase [Bifidobacterium commune]SCC78266.1 UDP-N-acetylmuramoylalanyl-D-glutamate--2,6-diaminopimelate ligase [Bifidobacterium commune]
MALSLASAAQLLKEHHLLREIVQGKCWTLKASDIEGCEEPFESISYDTRQVCPGTLLVVKGRFHKEYLQDIDAKGLACYVACEEYSNVTNAPGLIVNDAGKALALLSAEFYDRPQDKLTVIGITGTKGKTTTAYFTQALLNTVSGGKAALFSSVDNCLDGQTYEESDLTTPESLDAFRMMNTAVRNGMKYLVMEVSSQAYKVNRVYGLTFDVGAFLNISPDHISPIEHPSFEDYLYCKRQIVGNSRQLVLNADHSYAALIRQDAAAFNVPITTFALRTDETAAVNQPAPANVTIRPDDADHQSFTAIRSDKALDGAHCTDSRDTNCETLADGISLSMLGDFNYANAAAALAIACAAGINVADIFQSVTSVEKVRVAGRMEQFADPQSNTVAIVDYAHNFASIKAVLDFVDSRYGPQNPRITLVTGSAGNKAYDRRKEIVQAAQDRVEHFIFTGEDTDDEPIIDICMQMQSYITVPDRASTIISDRTTAISNAVHDARAHADRFNVILIVGKGNERWIKAHKKHVPFEGDDRIIERLFNIGQQQD